MVRMIRVPGEFSQPPDPLPFFCMRLSVRQVIAAKEQKEIHCHMNLSTAIFAHFAALILPILC